MSNQPFTGICRMGIVSVMPRSLGARIKARRRALELTQKDVAKRIGIDQSYISKWEKRVRPGPKHLRELARTLQWTVDQLLGEITEDENVSSGIPAQAESVLQRGNTRDTQIVPPDGGIHVGEGSRLDPARLSSDLPSALNAHARTLRDIAVFCERVADAVVRGQIATLDRAGAGKHGASGTPRGSVARGRHRKTAR